jgi:hypothetical protein
MTKGRNRNKKSGELKTIGVERTFPGVKPVNVGA